MAGQQTQDRRWEVNLEADELGQPDDRRFTEDVQGAMLEAAAILLRLGGAIQSYAVRQQDEQTGLWYPVKIVFKWQSFGPGVRAPRPAAPEPEVHDQVTVARTGEPMQVSASLAQPAAAVLELTDEPDSDGEVMVSPDGAERRSVPFGEMQEYLRAGWVPVAEVEDEDEGADS